MNVSFTVNGRPTAVDVPPKMVLLDILRDVLGLTGAKPGCEIGSCGACTVIVDGEAQNSCTFPASRLEGTAVLTIEGLAAPDGTPNDLQQAFVEHGAVQCGYCIPGIIMAGEALLGHNPTPNRTEIREALAGNLCRCTGYVQIVDAIEATARQRAGVEEAV
ncbi:MAG: (2Fe-2S)-binding protein [Ardenticatenaceae bacterium]|nr:(2Fe-2S)-binding protein [Ardenticatenaceae bacterium]